MIALPIPLIVSLALIFLLVRNRTHPATFQALLLACAVQGALISLVQHYGMTGLSALRPIIAGVIPPLAWVAFQTSVIRRTRPSQNAMHLIAPAFITFCSIFAPVTLDIVVAAVFFGYGGAMIWRLRRGDLPLATLAAGPMPARIWRTLALALILSGSSDVMIAVSYALGRGNGASLIISLFSSLALLAIGTLSLLPSAAGPPQPPKDPAPDITADTTREQDQALIARLDDLMTAEQLFRDADLNLTRLARRLHVPIKHLSTVINRHTGENVSRYVNGYRVRHACTLLERGQTVTDAMLDSGFNTKSNFNREFLRVTGKTPRDWAAPALT